MSFGTGGGSDDDCDTICQRKGGQGKSERGEFVVCVCVSYPLYERLGEDSLYTIKLLLSIPRFDRTADRALSTHVDPHKTKSD